MFQSRAQEPHVVYLCYERWLFCISHPHSCSTNIINQKGKPAGLIPWHCNSKKFLKSFLKKIWIKWIVSLCDEMVEARHFSDIYTHGPDRLAALQTIQGMFLFTFQAWMVPVPTLRRDSLAHLENCIVYNCLRQDSLFRFIKIYKNG